ncbi:hypothetical protein SLE2022_287550 [Rubroshorea leprosula]
MILLLLGWAARSQHSSQNLSQSSYPLPILKPTSLTLPCPPTKAICLHNFLTKVLYNGYCPQDLSSSFHLPSHHHVIFRFLHSSQLNFNCLPSLINKLVIDHSVPVAGSIERGFRSQDRIPPPLNVKKDGMQYPKFFLFDQGGIRVRNQKKLLVPVMDYDDTGPNPKHDPRKKPGGHP